MTSAQVVETSVTNNSSFQNYTHPDDHTIRTTDTPGFKPFTIERNKARERARMQISSRIDLQRQFDQLKAGEYTRDGGGQSISLEVFQNNEEKRQEREKQLQQEKEEREKIINDENTPISEKEKAEKKSKNLIKN